MKYAESILVVPRLALELAGFIAADPGVQLFCYERAALFEACVAQCQLFLPRGQMELDPTYKQIIPYMVFVYERKVFVMQRSAGAGEQRLAGAYTIGIGGHVRHSDVAATTIKAWGQREFLEEVAYDGRIKELVLIGLVNDDSNEVGRVHVGVVFLLHGDRDAIAVRSELQSGQLMTRDEACAVSDRMESWSKMVFDALVAAQKI